MMGVRIVARSGVSHMPLHAVQPRKVDGSKPAHGQLSQLLSGLGWAQTPPAVMNRAISAHQMRLIQLCHAALFTRKGLRLGVADDAG